MVCVALTTPLVAAQVLPNQIPQTVQQGMFSAAPTGIVWEQTAGSLPELVVRSPGSNPSQPSPWSAVRFGAPARNHADYSYEAIFGAWNTETDVELTDVSTGGDQTPAVDANGMLILDDMWYTLSFVVDRNSRGLPGSLVAQQRAQSPNNTAANTVFGYYADGSTGIDGSYIGNTFVEQSSTQLGYGAIPTGTVRGLDLGMGIISVSPNRLSNPFFIVRDRLYFAVTRAWVLENENVTVQGIGGGQVPVNSATIYVSTWTWDIPTGTGTWSLPMVAYPHDELGLSPDDQIDMVSVYKFGSADRVVFSLGAGSELDQILVYQRPAFGVAACSTKALTVQVGSEVQTVSRRAGIRPRDETPVGVDPDNVLGGCGTDPESSAALSYVIAVANGNSSATDKQPVGISMIKSLLPDEAGDPTEDTLHIEFTGLNVPAGQVGFLVKEVSLSNAPWVPMPYDVIYPGTTTNAFQLPGSWPGVTDVTVKGTFATYDPSTGVFSSLRGSVISRILY